MMLKERARSARTAIVDLDLAQKAEWKLNRYNMNLSGVLAFIFSCVACLTCATPLRQSASRLAEVFSHVV
jgi:hypothetical protein